jgi:hypothetical protein
MAFTLQNWGRASASALEPVVALQSGTVVNSFREYHYYSPLDVQATVAGAGYFNTVAYDLASGDLIRVYSLSETSYVTYRVVNTAGVITTVSVSTGGAVSSYAQVAMSNAEILGMYAAPKLLVAAPGAGNLLILDKIIINVVYGTVQFAAGGVVAPQYDSTVHGAGTLASSATIAAATVNGITSNSIVGLTGLIAVTASAALVNKGFYLSNATGAFTTGDSTAVVDVWYRTVTAS